MLVRSFHQSSEANLTNKLLTYLCRTLYDTIIYVNVGQTQERFGIHKSLLSHHSSYFRAVLEGGFEESETEVINLDEDPDVFWGFNEWLYSGAVPYQHYATDHGRWSALLNLYVFAEKRVIPSFQNALVDAMIEFASGTESWPTIEIRRAWVNTATSSPLRTFLVDLYARSVPVATCFSQNTEKRKCFDVDFVMRVAIALESMVEDVKGFRSGFSGLWEDRCLWHVHGSEDPPCRDDYSLTGSE